MTTMIRKLIEDAGKKFTDEILAALLATKVCDLGDAPPPPPPPEVPANGGRPAVAVVKEQLDRSVATVYCIRTESGGGVGVLPDGTVRKSSRLRDLKYSLRGKGYQVDMTSVGSYTWVRELTEVQREAFRRELGSA